MIASGEILAIASDELESSGSIPPEARPLVLAWMMSWLAEASLRRPGDWVDRFRPRLVSLSETIDLVVTFDGVKLTSASRDADTLVALSRGSRWFNGIDNIELELWRVVRPT